jgi:hypothetical protein
LPAPFTRQPETGIKTAGGIEKATTLAGLAALYVKGNLDSSKQMFERSVAI